MKYIITGTGLNHSFIKKIDETNWGLTDERNKAFEFDNLGVAELLASDMTIADKEGHKFTAHQVEFKTKFLILATGYNCAQYIEGCLNSIKAQTYDNYEVILVDDGSTDDTPSKIMEFKHEDWSFARNKGERAGTIMARDMAIRNHETLQYDVIVWLDLDDQLEPNALEVVAKAYEDESIWVTYGNMIDNQGKVFTKEEMTFADEPIRKQDWKYIHLRTFRKELWFKLTFTDLFPERKTVYPEINPLYCILEMAQGHIKWIDDVIYRYNNDNPLAIRYAYTAEERISELEFINGLPPKEKIESL